MGHQRDAGRRSHQCRPARSEAEGQQPPGAAGRLREKPEDHPGTHSEGNKGEDYFRDDHPDLDNLHAQRKAGFDRFEADVQKYNIAAVSVMKQAGMPINDLHKLVERGGKEKLMGGDGTHYTQEGYEMLAAAVTDSILRSLAQLNGSR